MVTASSDLAAPHMLAKFAHGSSGGRLVYTTQQYSMSASSAIRNESKVSQGPAWGLQEQSSRLRKDGGSKNVAPTVQQDPGRSKIRVSVTGPALAHKIEQVLHVCEMLQSPVAYAEHFLLLFPFDSLRYTDLLQRTRP